MYRKPADWERCTGPAPQRGKDNRCHNYAVADGLCKVHLRLAGKATPGKACAVCGTKMGEVRR